MSTNPERLYEAVRAISDDYRSALGAEVGDVLVRAQAMLAPLFTDNAEIARLQAQVESDRVVIATMTERLSSERSRVDTLRGLGSSQCEKIAELQAQVDGLRTGLDVWSATAGRAQARNVELQAHVDALALALRKIATIGNEDGLSRDEYQQRLIASAGYARVALTAAGRWPE